ncbi:MAG: hypothetical protein QOF48_503 [Verrucomicrobiota bacterium]|jgi:regulator of sirC expression with transglutaminase-like and TPR domain
MQALDPIQIPGTLPERQREALISLLADEDPVVYSAVRAKLLGFGPAASQWLRPHTLSSDPTLRRRAVEIVRHQARRVADGRFLDFCRSHGEELDLEEGAGMLAQTHYPDAHLGAYRALFDAWANELRTRIDPAAAPERILGVVHRFLFVELGFSGSEDHTFDPDTGYVNCIVDRRTGNPIGLGAIYLLVTRRLRLPITGIGLPGHFICRHQDSRGELYIDPFAQGRFLKKAECIRMLLHTSFVSGEKHLAPLSGRRILLRFCQQLVNSYAHLEQPDEARRVQRYVTVLSK